jgi:hypothetical protein
MAGVIKAVIVFVVANFPLSFLVLGLLVALVAIARAKRPLGGGVRGASAVEKLLSWYLFFPIGCSFLLNFVFHVFFGAMSARFIGWADSPFQLEVGMASLGFAAVGFLAFSRGFEMRLAAVVGPALFLLGAAAGHVHQMIAAHNFAPGNAGPVFYMDIVIPLVGLALLWLDRRFSRA